MHRSAAILLDLLLVVTFAALGRASHSEPLDLAGLSRTALPFLAGTLLAWITLTLRGRQSGLSVRIGAYIWALTLTLGMLFRLMIGNGTAPEFIAVAAVVLAVFLIGWRAVRTLWVRRHGGRRVKDPRRSGNPARRNAAG